MADFDEDGRSEIATFHEKSDERRDGGESSVDGGREELQDGKEVKTVNKEEKVMKVKMILNAKLKVESGR